MAADLPLGAEAKTTTAYPHTKGTSDVSSPRNEDAEVWGGWPQAELRLPGEESRWSEGAKAFSEGGSWLQGIGGLHDASKGEDEECCPPGV